MQYRFITIYDERMASVVATLEAHNNCCLIG
jgi:hypothetical protein